MTWAGPLGRLRAAGFVEERISEGAILNLLHPGTRKEAWVSMHIEKDAGRLARRILHDAGLE